MVVVLGNGVVGLSPEVFFLLGTAKEESVDFEGSQRRQIDRLLKNLINGHDHLSMHCILFAMKDAGETWRQEGSSQFVVSRWFIIDNLEKLVYVFGVCDFGMSGETFIDRQFGLKPDVALDNISCEADLWAEGRILFGQIGNHAYAFEMVDWLSDDDDDVTVVEDMVFFERIELICFFWRKLPQGLKISVERLMIVMIGHSQYLVVAVVWLGFV